MTARKLVSTMGALAVLILAAGVSPVLANPNAAIRITVPFAFEAGVHSLPAGQYLVQHRTGNGIVVFTLPDGTRRILIAFPTGNPANPKGPRMVFERMGGTCRLAEVWTAGAAHGGGIPETKAQKLLARQLKKERVEVVARARD